MSLFISLPIRFRSSLFSEWLTIVEVVHMDSAFCSTAQREEFYSMAYRSDIMYSFAKTINFNHKIGDAVTSWILSRLVLVPCIYATAAFVNSHDIRKEYLRRHGHAIEVVEYSVLSGRKDKAHLHHRSALDIAQCCPNLIKFVASELIDTKDLVRIIESCPLLESLKLGYNACPIAALSAVARVCTKLREVELVCGGYSCTQQLIALARNNPGLTRLKISGGEITASLLRELAVSCPELAVLSICDGEPCIVITESALYSFLMRSKSLTSLFLSGCDIISDTVQPEEITEPLLCNNLRRLSLEGVNITDDVLDELLWACPGLTALKITECSKLVDVGAFRIGTRYPALQELTMRCNGGCLRHNDYMSDNSESGESGNCSGSDDSESDESGPPAEATDHLLIDISENCLDLRCLDVSESSEVTDSGISAVVKGCPLLAVLNVTGCTNVTNVSMAAFAQYGHNLQQLTMSRCAQITDMGVERVMQDCPRLVGLSIGSCFRTSKKMRRAASELHIRAAQL